MRIATIANAIDKELEAVKAITIPQNINSYKKAFEMTELVVKRSVFSKTNNPIDMANLVYGKLTFDTVKNEDDSVSNVIESGISMMGHNQLVESQKLEIVDMIKFPIVTTDSEKGIKDGGVLEIKKEGRYLPTKEIIGMTFRDTQMAEAITRSPLWIRPNGLEQIIVTEPVTGMYFDVVNNKDYTGVKPSLDGIWKRYVFFKATPGECRMSSCVGINTIVSYKGKLVIDNKRGFKAIDFLTYGAASMLLEEGDLKLKKFAKGFARLAQWSPYSRDFGKLKSFWVLNGKFDESDANDGISYVLVEVIIDAIYHITGVKLSEKVLLGKAIQCRPGLAKTMAMIVSRSFMATLVNVHKEQGYNKIIGANEELPSFLADSNCNKAEVKSVNDISFTVLAPMVTLSKPRLNVQLVAKIVNSDLFEEIIDEAYEAELAQRFNFLNTEAREQTIAAVKSGVASQALMMFAPALANTVNSIRANAIETAAKSMVHDISKMNLPLKGSKWMRLTGDVGGSFGGVRLLNVDEIYAPGMKEGKEIEVVRFPAPCPFEHFPAKTVNKRTVIERAKHLLMEKQLNISEFNAIKEYIDVLDVNILMAPKDQRFRDLTGGSDTDADMGIVIWNSKIVKAIRETAPLSIDSIKPIEDILAGVLDASGHREAYLRTILAPKVGVVCNHITALIEVGYLSKDAQIEIIKNVLNIEEIGTGKYTQMFDHEMAVGLTEYDAACNAMVAADINDDEVRKNVLADAMVLAKTINDRTIDAPKTGDQIDNVLKWRKYVRSSIFCTLSINKEVTNDSGTKFSIGVTDDDVNPDHCGRISKVRQSIADKFAGTLNDMLKETVELTGKERALIGAISGRSEAVSFAHLKTLYNDVSGLKRAERETIENDFLAQQKLAWYQARVDAIKNMGLMVAKSKGLDDVQVGRLAFYTSAARKIDGAVQATSVVSNNFMTVVFPEATMQMAAKFYGANTELKQEIYAVNDAKLIDGEILVMKNGTGYRDTNSDPVAICEARLDGEYTVEREENPGVGFFIKSDIKEQFAVPKVNGSVLIRVHSNELKEKGAVKRLANLLGAADHAVIFCPLGKREKGQRDSLTLYRDNKQFASVRISIEGVDLMRVLHGKKIDIVNPKSGVIKSRSDKDILTMNILGNLIGADSIDMMEDKDMEDQANLMGGMNLND